MIRDLVIYFLRQGMYSEPGDIAVLCAYLGQLQKVRAALRDMKIAVAVDERDAEELARQGLEEQIDFEEVLVAKHVSDAQWLKRICNLNIILCASYRCALGPSISSKGKRRRLSSSRLYGTRGSVILVPRRLVS